MSKCSWKRPDAHEKNDMISRGDNLHPSPFILGQTKQSNQAAAPTAQPAVRANVRPVSLRISVMPGRHLNSLRTLKLRNGSSRDRRTVSLIGPDQPLVDSKCSCHETPEPEEANVYTGAAPAAGDSPAKRRAAICFLFQAQ